MRPLSLLSRLPRLALRVSFILLLGITIVGCDSGGGGSSDPDPPDPDPDPVVPNAPSNLTATSGDGEVVLDWQSVSQADTYTVYRSTSAGSTSSGSAIETGLTSTGYTDTGASNGVTYFYQVTAVADEEGDASNEIEVTPFAEPPSRP